MRNEISILLATYNGAKYLGQLIDSIISQTYTNWTLYIHDDMSVDNTFDIIKEYSSKYENIIFISDTKKRGSAGSFLWLLDKVESDYYMFCDQDDIWLPNKIFNAIRQIKILESEYKNKPVLIYSDLIIVDAKLNIIDKSFFEYSKISYYVDKLSFLPVLNFITGCTMAFNRKAKDITFPVSSNVVMHDSWLALRVYYEKGIIKCTEQSDILYRQHASNALGAVKYRSVVVKFLKLNNVLKNNIKYYLMAKDAAHISLFKYLLLKLKVLTRNVC